MIVLLPGETKQRRDHMRIGVIGKSVIMFDMKSETDRRLMDAIKNRRCRHDVIAESSDIPAKIKSVMGETCKNCGFSLTDVVDSWNSDGPVSYVIRFQKCPLCGKET